MRCFFCPKRKLIDNLSPQFATFAFYAYKILSSMNEDIFKKLIAHSKEYGFIFPSSEIYDGLGAVYDYGQMGAELKNNIKRYWWDAMVRLNENIVGIDSAIFMHPRIWEASGHVGAFNDPLIDNKDSKKRYRADVLVEDHIAKIEEKIEKEVEKARKRFGESFDEEQFRTTNPRVLENTQKIEEIRHKLADVMNANDLEAFRQLIIDLDIVCPISGSRNWTDVRQFNLMFSTQMGSVSEDANVIYLRPETAQGIFVNYLNVQKTGRMKLPFGIAQIGKAFRNEIVARQFIFRMREFEQMEMQFFIRPGSEMEWYEHWKQFRLKWHKALGLGDKKYRFHDHDKLAHYANAAADIEFDFPFGFKELEGIHSRTNFDLSSHEKFSGKKLRYFDPETNESYIPYVVETSIGVDRMVLAVLSTAYTEEKITKEDDSVDERVVMRIPPALAPIKMAVMPLVKKDGLPEKAREIMNELKFDFMCQYDEKDSIGKRYRRQDAIGTPFCVTIDHQTLEDNMVTIRYRDTMEQERVPISSLRGIMEEKVSMRKLLTQLM
jgi:glycyl-tRNA synthetase